MTTIVAEETQETAMLSVLQDRNVRDDKDNNVDMATEKMKRVLQTLNAAGCCKVCDMSRSFYANDPCYHVTSCRDCGPRISLCPDCRQPIRNVLTYTDILQQAYDRLMQEY
ncbi:hypothetical protein Btru_054051 [Bulinus truncatus]|nr:hypothetical protein Btru_054051 [Bulinus truncatus]